MTSLIAEIHPFCETPAGDDGQNSAALGALDPKTDLTTLRARLWGHFSEKEIGVLTATVGMINLWNGIAISRH